MTNRGDFINGDTFEAEGEADGDVSCEEISRIWNETRIKVQEVDRSTHGDTTFWTARGRFYTDNRLRVSPFMALVVAVTMILQTFVIVCR